MGAGKGWESDSEAGLSQREGRRESRGLPRGLRGPGGFSKASSVSRGPQEKPRLSFLAKLSY